MPFGKFFDRGGKNAKPATEAARDDESAVDESADDTALDTESDDGDTPEEIPAEHDESTWLMRARAVLPTGASTGSKRVEALYGSSDAIGPTHFTRAVGAHVFDADGNE